MLKAAARQAAYSGRSHQIPLLRPLHICPTQETGIASADGTFDLQRTFREIMFLQELGSHENIIKYGASLPHSYAFDVPCSLSNQIMSPQAVCNACRLQNVLKAENDKDIYLIFDYMETDLHAVIRANILEDIHKSYIMYQLFRALKYMHSADLLHRDIKVFCITMLPTADAIPLQRYSMQAGLHTVPFRQAGFARSAIGVSNL